MSSFRMLPPCLMPLDDMVALYNGLQTISDVLTAITNQPRFKMASPSGYTEAGDFLDDLSQLIGHAKDYVADAAEERRPIDSDEFAERAHILIVQALRCEGITAAAELAQELYASPRGEP